MKARKARGSDLIFGDENRYQELVLDGRLPGGAKDSVRCKVAGVVPFIIMKGMAIGRGKPKDGYDIEYVIANYPGGTEALVNEFKKELKNQLVQEGLGKMYPFGEAPLMVLVGNIQDPWNKQTRI